MRFTTTSNRKHSLFHPFTALMFVVGAMIVFLNGCASGTSGSGYLTIGPIVATFSQATSTTTYHVTQVTYNGDSTLPFIHYAWSKTNERQCGTFTVTDASTITWAHPDTPPNGCPDEAVHPGTISVTVSAEDENQQLLTLFATYPNGSAAGTGPSPAPSSAANP